MSNVIYLKENNVIHIMLLLLHIYSNSIISVNLRLLDWRARLCFPGELAEPGSHLHKTKRSSALLLFHSPLIVQLLKGKSACNSTTKKNDSV